MILYYTGTGNSRYAAELLGHRLNDTVRDCTPFMQGGTTPRFHSVTPWVFVCPTYAWQIPHLFADFLTRCHFSGSRQAYFVMTCGGEIHNARRQTGSSAPDWGWNIWAQQRSLCRKITLPCFPPPTRRKK